MVWGLAAELDESTFHGAIVKILQGPRHVQKIRVVQLAELQGDLPSKLLLVLPKG